MIAPGKCSFRFRAGPMWAIAEVLLFQAVLLTLLPLERLLQYPEAVNWSSSLLLLYGPGSLIWCAVRLRLPTHAWWRKALYETLMSGALSLLTTFSILLFFLLAAFTAPPSSREASLPQLVLQGLADPRVRLIELIGIFSMLFCGFLFCRVGLRLLARWNRMRRTRLRWALTHAHLLVVLLGAGLLSLLVVLVNSSNSPGFPLYVISFLFLMLIMTGIALALVLPPSAIFSYLFSRRLTRRIETLAAAASALRAGNLDVRVQVQGEDEIARLQADFNAMADALQLAMRELQAERDNVATLLKVQRELIASVSHELRTPVATLRGYLESTRTHWTETPPPTLRQDLEVMEQETIRLQALINDLFTLARAEVGRLEMRLEPIDVGGVAHRVVAATAPLAWQSGRVEVVAAVAGETPRALADVTRLEQVLHNLVHNGIRHTPPGGIVAVTAQAGEDSVILQVKDTGEGIVSAELPRIWERFYRTRRSRERPASGTGLGLALVKELTEAMGGSVAVESTPGEGSCFTIYLPRAGDDTCPPSGVGEALQQIRALEGAH